MGLLTRSSCTSRFEFLFVSYFSSLYFLGASKVVRKELPCAQSGSSEGIYFQEVPRVEQSQRLISQYTWCRRSTTQGALGCCQSNSRYCNMLLRDSTSIEDFLGAKGLARSILYGWLMLIGLRSSWVILAVVPGGCRIPQPQLWMDFSKIHVALTGQREMRECVIKAPA